MASQAALKVHLYSPWAADPARPSPPSLIMIQGKDPGYFPGAQMTAEGGDWFVYTFKNDAPAVRDGFKFVDYLPKGGNQYADGITFDDSGSDFTMGAVFLTPGVQEVWIIPQGVGKPPLITDIPPATKAVYLFNPWPETAPAIRLSGDTASVRMRVSQDKSRCGWYVHYFTAKDYAVTFKSVVGTDVYGLGGATSSKPIDLAPYFATGDTVFLVPDPVPGGAPAIRTSFPAGVAGTCSFPLAVTIRDFSSKHTDFEKDGMGGNLTKGMVTAVLPPDKKPRQGPVFFFQTHFDKWFATDSTNPDPTLRNYETCRDLPMSKDRYGYWGHDSYDDADHSFFPIDDFNRFGETFNSHYRDRATGDWVDGQAHNFHFCMEMHANFKYRQGQVFRFSGDDDVWVYIDNRLAIDIGGTHGPTADSVSVDTMKLTPGNKYDFDLYYCERKTQGSNLLIQTSIFFEQDQSVWARHTGLGAGRNQYDIFEIISGDRSCGGSKGDTVAAKSTFTLSGPSVNPARELPEGTSYGGITVNAGKTQVIVDSAKVTGLRPGVYTVTYVSSRSGKGGSLTFTVGGNPGVEFAEKPPVNVLVGASVPVRIHAVLNGATDKRAETFRLSPQAGLQVYEDSALTRPIAAGTDLATEAATGIRQVWVTSRLPGTYGLDLLAGPSLAVIMDDYRNLAFFKQPIAVKKAWYLDKDGDGRIESAVVEFTGEAGTLPDRLEFAITDPTGASASAGALAADGTIARDAGSKDRARVTFAVPFPFGITSIANSGGVGRVHGQADVPILEASFPVEDSVAPVVFSAEAVEPDSLFPVKRIRVTYSENAQVPLGSKTALVFKREGGEIPAGQVLIEHMERTGDREYVFYLDPASEVLPVSGDSVSINPDGETRDAAGNTPAYKLFRKLDGAFPKTPPLDLFVTFPNGSRENPSSGAEPGPDQAVFIPVGKDGAPLPGSGIGKCGGCQADRNGTFVGPIFNMETPGPMAYAFKIFSNLGEFVAEGTGRIEADDLPRLGKTGGIAGVKYQARVVWTGRTADGGKAGTGAYILTAVLRTDTDLKTGAQPKTETRKTVFGLLRSFQGR
ncbi:MAG: fibro-slime family protein [Fibrobacteres bacterium]|nr:fibro-slime family protein [Fibrobacterota bacterium]